MNNNKLFLFQSNYNHIFNHIINCIIKNKTYKLININYNRNHYIKKGLHFLNKIKTVFLNY